MAFEIKKITSAEVLNPSPGRVTYFVDSADDLFKAKLENGAILTFKGDPGETAYQLAVDQGFSGTEEEWLESLVGAPGTPGSKGDTGEEGKSAYQVAVDNGFVGTQEDWLATLVADSLLPYYIPEGKVYYIPEYKQAYAGRYITVDGTLIIDGILVDGF